MANIALFVDGAILDIPCRAKAVLVNGAAGVSGALTLNSDSISKMLDAVGVSQDTALAVCKAAAVPKIYAEFCICKEFTSFVASTDALSFILYKRSTLSMLISFETNKLKASNLELFKVAADAAEFLGIQSLFFKMGSNQIPQKYMASTALSEIGYCPKSFSGSDMLLYGTLNFTDESVFTNGLKNLFNISKMSFGVAKLNSGCVAGLYIDDFTLGNVKISSFFCAIKNKGFIISGNLTIDNFSLVLECSAGMSEFALLGYLPHGNEISLGNDWRITELAVAVGYKNGIMISLLGRIVARKLMIFAAISMSVQPTGASLNFMSAATSNLTIPNIVNSFAKEQINGAESFNFVQIEGFTLLGAKNIEASYLNADISLLAEGFNKAMAPCNLTLKGTYKVTKFGNEKILTDEHCMRNYTIYSNGQIVLNPQFYFAPTDCGAFAGYEIRKGAFFCGVLKIFDFSVKLFFQIDDNGIMAYLNISPIYAGIFELTQSSMKSAPNVVKPSPGGMVSQFLDPNTQGPELFICMAKSQSCFYIDARLKLWNILCFDAHVVYADNRISIDARFDFLNIFNVSFYLRADYSSFNSLNFEFALIADTSGLKRLVEKAINKIEGAAREFNNRMSSAINSIDQARCSVNGLWESISNFDNRINDCRRRISNAPWYKRWYIAIGAGFEICGYEIAKAGVYIAIGVANAALAIAEGILRAAQAVGNVTLSAVKGFLQGVISLFYIERLAFAGVVNKSGGAMGVKMDFVALGKSYSVQGMLDMGSGAGERCGNLLNNMVEDKTANDVRELNSTSRSSKKAYRTAAIEEQKLLYSQAADYCRVTKNYMRDLNAAYTRDFGCIMPQSEEVTLGVDSAMREANQSANLILDLTDSMNFNTAFDEVQKELDAAPSTKANHARGRSLENLKAQWNDIQSLKNEMRSQSRKINTSTKQSVFEASQEKVEAVIKARQTRSAQEVYQIDPDKILNTAESYMYAKFKPTRNRLCFCPYNEPVILNALDECRTDKNGVSDKRQRQRSAYRQAGYKTRL